MVRVRVAMKPKELRWRRTKPVPPAPTGDALRCSFHQLKLEDPPRQVVRSAPQQAPQQVPWHQSSVSRSTVPAQLADHPGAVQVPKISSQEDDDIQILEELCQPPLATSTPPAPTWSGDVTSTTRAGSSSCPGLDLSEELRWLNNHQYYGTMDMVQEYLNRMNSFGIFLEPWMWILGTGNSSELFSSFY